MKLTEEKIQELAFACRLHLTAEEAKKFRNDLEALTDLAAPLLEVPKEEGSGEDSRALSFGMEGMRDDRVLSAPDGRELLWSAPHVREHYIAVPRTVEEA